MGTKIIKTSHKYIAAFSICCIFQINTSFSASRNPDHSDTERDQIVRILGDPTIDWRTKIQSFSKANEYIEDEKVSSAVALLLENETTQQIQNPEVRADEARGEYYMEIITLVSHIQDGEIAIPVLVNTLGQVGGIFVPNALSQYRNQAIVPLKQKYDSIYFSDLDTDGVIRSDILFTLKEIIRIRVESTSIWILTEQQYDDLDELLLKGSEDTSPFARRWAIEALSILEGASIAR